MFLLNQIKQLEKENLNISNSVMILKGNSQNLEKFIVSNKTLNSKLKIKSKNLKSFHFLSYYSNN